MRKKQVTTRYHIYQGVVLIQIELRIVRSSTRTLYGFSQPQITLSKYRVCIKRLLNCELPVHPAMTIIFYDIPSTVGPWSPNTWKVRLVYSSLIASLQRLVS